MGMRERKSLPPVLLEDLSVILTLVLTQVLILGHYQLMVDVLAKIIIVSPYI